MIYILYSSNVRKWSRETFDRYQALVPFDPQRKAGYYRRWQDAQAHLLGRLLLIQGLQLFNIDRSGIPPLRYTKYQRPYFDLEIDINIAHSGDYVLCALSNHTQVGVDIERVRPIALEDMRLSFSDKEWAAITAAADPNRQLFDCWTRKEAVIKADGRGMAVAHRTILEASSARIENTLWYLKKLTIAEGYCAYLATRMVVHDSIDLRFIDIAA